MTESRRQGNRLLFTALLYGVFLVLLVSPAQALAAESGSDWRQVYDVVMIWVNFLILVALLVKFLRQPLGRFLQERRDDVQGTLDRLETEKDRMQAEIQSLQQQLDDRRQRATELNARIVAQGRAERREILAAARQEAARRIDKARQQIDARHREARLKLRNELIDAAVEKAMAILPRRMTREVERHWVDQFLKSLSDSKR